MKTAVGAPAPPPSTDEMIDAIAKMTVSEFMAFRERVAEVIRMQEKRKKLH